MPDSIDGEPNPGKKMFGDVQMDWLKNALLFSNRDSHVSFRIIATGSQVLNAWSPFDCFRHFPEEYNDLMDFIRENHIEGVIFLTGDRHHSEIIRQDREGTYPLYDITVSPFTSSVAKTHGPEVNNPDRVGKEIDAQNYAVFSFTGQGNDRSLKVSFRGLRGDNLMEWSVNKSDLREK
jgi:alkaline phosphatase D